MSAFLLVGAGARAEPTSWSVGVPATAPWSELSPYERDYCAARPHPAQHAAGRIAAKRAAVLAVQRATGIGVAPEDLEITPGAPLVPGPAGWGNPRRPVCRPRDPGRGDLAAVLASMSISIRHTPFAAMAAAVMIVELRPQ